MFESLRMTARSITFCSSRMFPGHAYACRSLSVFLSMLMNFFPTFFPKRAMKYSASKGISAARSLWKEGWEEVHKHRQENAEAPASVCVAGKHSRAAKCDRACRHSERLEHLCCG